MESFQSNHPLSFSSIYLLDTAQMDGVSSPKQNSVTEDTITRHKDFYFSDGSVVIIVENTAFRVHQTVLARHSDVFRGMWDVPQPPDQELYDDCPCLLLMDSADDFVDVLKVIYDAFHFDEIKPDTSLSTLITFISGILRISTKYGMHQLRNKCISIIQDKFPSTLRGCDDVLSRMIQYGPSEIVRIIPLARETNIPKVLPWAFYLCTHISVDELVSSQVLSWSDKAYCLAGREKLWDMLKKETHSFLLDFKQSPTCTGSCQTRVMMPRQLKLNDIESLRINPHPLEEYKEWKSLMICTNCLSMVEAQHRKGREKVWQRLPTLFHLPTWDEINKDQSC